MVLLQAPSPRLIFNMRVALNTMFSAAQRAAFSFSGQEKHRCDRLAVDRPIGAMHPAHPFSVYLVDANINDWRKKETELTFTSNTKLLPLLQKEQGITKNVM